MHYCSEKQTIASLLKTLSLETYFLFNCFWRLLFGLSFSDSLLAFNWKEKKSSCRLHCGLAPQGCKWNTCWWVLSLQPEGHWCRAAASQHSHLSSAAPLSVWRRKPCRKPGELYNITYLEVPELRSHPPLSTSPSAQQTPWQQQPGRPAVCATPQGLQTHGWIHPNNCIVISAFIAQTSYKEWNKNVVVKRQ